MRKGSVEDLRGEPLTTDCKWARWSFNELPGVIGCRGRTDYNPDIYNDECKQCGALVWNITQEAVDRIRKESSEK